MSMSFPFAKHKAVAVLIYFAVCGFEALADGKEAFIIAAIVLLIPLLYILFHRVTAFFASVGFWEFFARDYKKPDPMPTEPYAFLPWLVYIVLIMFLLFNWRVY